MSTKNNIKKIIAILFVFFLTINFFKDGSYHELQLLFEYLSQNTELIEDENALTIASLETEFSSKLWKQQDFINLNGAMARILNMKGFYSDMGMYVTDNMYIVSGGTSQTSTDYEYEELVSFNEFLQNNGINLLYVNEPNKYIDDSLIREEFGIETYSNRNMDKFLSRIRDAGINAIDIRDNIVQENLDVQDLFYRTDHHWTTKAGLWATQIIASGLNDYCDYNIDVSIYDEKRYTFINYSDCWLGEQGRKIAESYVGLDDYTVIKPNFPTSYIFKLPEGDCQGDFSFFIDEEVYNLESNVYENRSWHYSYNQINCINNNVEDGKLLIIGDSFEQITEPFISLGVHEVDSLILRKCDDSFSLRNYIIENGYDTVIVCYSQSMLGAHDNSASANYKMFAFDN